MRLDWMPKVALPLLAFCGSFSPLGATSTDYLAASISPKARFNGQSGNFRLNAPVPGGTLIEFNLNFSVVTSGQTQTTKYPRTVTFGVVNIGKPDGVADDPNVQFDNNVCTFEDSNSTCTTKLIITAPPQDGAYHVKIAAIDGVGGSVGLSGSSGVVVHFVVANPTTLTEVPTTLALGITNNCIVYRTPSVVLTAFLTRQGTAVPVAGMTIQFTVGASVIGTAVTLDNGVATFTYNPTALTVGDYTVYAAFQGATVGTEKFLPAEDSKALGVIYNFEGFQPPLDPVNTDKNVIKGNSAPVKVRISDYNQAPVPDAAAYLFYTYLGSTPLVEVQAAPQGNSTGNQMTYDDPLYIFTWDVNNLANGGYKLRVGIVEGACAEPHTIGVTLAGKKN